MGLLKKIIGSIIDINSIKGRIGEMKVDNALNPIFFDKTEHRQINNLLIIDNGGNSHQIDHIEIRSNGIFCIETKNYSGLIFGSANQDKWTQCLWKGKKNYFYNPIKQNKSHIFHLKNILENKYNINSLIVFTQNNADKININNVINLCDLKNYLNNFNDGSNYTEDDMNYIYEKLISNNKHISNSEHIKNIDNTKQKIKNNICPRCSGKLILRKGKYREFYGCSNYPNCKFTIKK
ncbi:NERD domain-containing protein [Brachyspira sp.]|uniref:NERD domain-containing protein n=1 Tax=Brachyspira sp. TaxID=1977261 RepID=UPI00261A4457|nr:NERD domain-containing protein [Brachyspira sp.]